MSCKKKLVLCKCFKQKIYILGVRLYIMVAWERNISRRIFFTGFQTKARVWFTLVAQCSKAKAQFPVNGFIRRPQMFSHIASLTCWNHSYLIHFAYSPNHQAFLSKGSSCRSIDGKSHMKKDKRERKALGNVASNSIRFIDWWKWQGRSIMLSLSRSLCALLVYEDVLCEGKIFLEDSQNRDTNLLFSLFL